MGWRLQTLTVVVGLVFLAQELTEHRVLEALLGRTAAQARGPIALAFHNQILAAVVALERHLLGVLASLAAHLLLGVVEAGPAVAKPRPHHMGVEVLGVRPVLLD